ncbi:MAG: HAD hydrolase-like protein [bacterium]|nr:HAD hydrolase-like protein [bacterium]
MQTWAWVFDFDGTIAQTFKPSPSGIGVNEATRMAVGKIFGMPGLAVFDDLGGLRNKAPIEIINEIISKASGLVWLARDTFISLHFHGSEFASGAGVPLIWPDSDNDIEGIVAVATELFVRAKMAIYISEIRMWPSGPWPAPCDGIVDCLNRIEKNSIPWAVLSSGHEVFIKKTFELWGAGHPEIMITDDDLRGSSLPLEKRFKPNEAIVQFLLARWRQREPRISNINMSQVVYVGDDPNKDGHLARNAGTRFVWYNPNGLPLPSGGIAPDLEIRHYSELFP